MWFAADVAAVGNNPIPFLYVLLMVALPVVVMWAMTRLMQVGHDDCKFVVFTPKKRS